MNLHARKKHKWNLASRFLIPAIYLSSNQFPLSTLELLGFVDSYLEDDSKSIDNCLLLIFQPSREIYESEKWTYFIAMISRNNGLIEIVEYSLEDRIFGFWMKMHEKFHNKLIFAFRKGKYSYFPEDYKQLLAPLEKAICKKDKTLQAKKEIELGLKEGFLSNLELENVPSELDIKFTLK